MSNNAFLGFSRWDILANDLKNVEQHCKCSCVKKKTFHSFYSRYYKVLKYITDVDNDIFNW